MTIVVVDLTATRSGHNEDHAALARCHALRTVALSPTRQALRGKSSRYRLRRKPLPNDLMENWLPRDARALEPEWSQQRGPVIVAALEYESGTLLRLRARDDEASAVKGRSNHEAKIAACLRFANALAVIEECRSKRPDRSPGRTLTQDEARPKLALIQAR